MKILSPILAIVGIVCSIASFGLHAQYYVNPSPQKDYSQELYDQARIYVETRNGGWIAPCEQNCSPSDQEQIHAQRMQRELEREQPPRPVLDYTQTYQGQWRGVTPPTRLAPQQQSRWW